MKNVLILLGLLAIGIGIFVYVSHEKTKIAEKKSALIQSMSVSMTSGATSATQSTASPPAEFKLRILSDPDGATIYVADARVGVAPFEMGIPLESKKVRLSLEGYEDYSRQIPAAKDAEGDLVWKIQLKKTSAKGEAPPSLFKRGTIGPFLVQLKSISLKDFSNEQAAQFATAKAKFCKVALDRDIWVRIVVGPYASKQKALEALARVKEKYPEAFLTQKQVCLE